MFERFTEKARRVIFFARYEASTYGCHEIGCEHLLLGIVREDKALSVRLFGSSIAADEIARRLDLKPTGPKIETSVDLPMSHSAKRSLAYASEESERLGHSTVGTVHLALGLLREPGSVQTALVSWGVLLDQVRKLAQSEVKRGTTDLPAISVVAPLTQEDKIVAALRASFDSIAARVTPDIEPAVIYSLKEDIR